MKFGTWLRQPSTITGLASALGIALGLAAHLLTGDATASAAVGGAAFSLVQLVINDNTVAADAQALAQTGVQIAAGGAPAAATLAPAVAQELLQLFRDALAHKPMGALPPRAAAKPDA